jgi:predicted membrane metal-binding protein
MALALVLKRKGVPENTLGASVTLILIASPFTILNIGFLLSVLATFGVVGVALPIVSFIRSRKLIKSKLLYLIISAITVNVSATVCTLPVTVSSFKCVSVVSVLSNLLISLAVDVILWSAVFGLALNVLYPALAKVAFLVTKVAASYINWAISFFGGLDFAVISVPWYAAIVFIVLIILIFYALLACKKRIDMVKLKEMRKKLALEGGKCKNGCGF